MGTSGSLGLLYWGALEGCIDHFDGRESTLSMSQSVDCTGDPALELWLVSSQPVSGGSGYWPGTLSLGLVSRSGGGKGGGGAGLGGGGSCVMVGLEYILEWVRFCPCTGCVLGGNLTEGFLCTGASGGGSCTLSGSLGLLGTLSGGLSLRPVG